MTQAEHDGRSTVQPRHSMAPRPYRVCARRQEIADCVTLEMTPEDGLPLHFAPGQFTMLYVHGVGEIAISISGDPAEPERLVQTIRSVGAVSAALTDLSVGQRIGVRGPFGNPWPVETAINKHLIVIAGGLGLAPTRPVIYWALANRQSLKSLDIVYGARSPDQILYGEQIVQWSQKAGIPLGVTVDQATDGWKGHVGVVTDLLPSIVRDPNETVAMTCGPEIMMRFAALALASLYVPQEQIHLSLERNMKCGIGWCGHCQMGPYLLCRDGPVLPFAAVRDLIKIREL